MSKTSIGTALAAAVAAMLLGSAAWAADAAHPYSNVDHAVDAGNNTGDSETDQLNQQQLQKNAPNSGSQTSQPGRNQPGRNQPWQANGYAGYPPPGAYGYPAAYAYPPPYAYPVPYGYAPYYVRGPYPWWRPRVWGPRYGFWVR